MTRYDLFRKRIAPIAFFCAIALIAYDTWNKKDHTTATFVLDFGPAESSVQAVDAELWMDGDQLSTFHEVALAGHTIGPAKFKQSMPDRDGELRIDVTRASGHTKITRHFHADDDATIKVLLERDLR